MVLSASRNLSDNFQAVIRIVALLGGAFGKEPNAREASKSYLSQTTRLHYAHVVTPRRSLVQINLASRFPAPFDTFSE